VAVLYFDNLSPDTADAYLADGLTEELLARLRQIERLTVKSRTAVARFRASRLDPRALGRALGVAHLVSGSVRRSGTKLRVSVELVRAASGVSTWGDQYDRADGDLLAIQEDIGRAVTTAIAGRLLPAEQASLAGRPTRSREAYDHFVKGNYYLAQRTGNSVIRAIEEYHRAVALDPRFGPGFARMALAYALFVDWGWNYPGLAPESLLVRGLAASDTALRVDPDASDSWMARAYVLALYQPRAPDAARAAFERAIALDTTNAEAYHQFAPLLAALGEDSAAAAAYRRALELEPERPITLLQLGGLMLMEHRFAEGRRWLDSTLRVDPSFAYAYAMRGLISLLLRDTAQARGDAATAVRLGAGYVGEAAVAAVEAREGDTTGARTRAEVLVQQAGETGPVSATEGIWLAIALVGVAQDERAIDVLERVRPGGWLLRYYLRLPFLDPIRAHPRFQRLLAESQPR
jgi:TolB-like protein/Tfp pilus assembly protein PilF